ncbi:MAG TPA: BBP7 family outer membrane beta-barrel protein [Gemmataceae bacterium]|nr:BBP7 family outer membrane beta-barrel protein [Gemmataceae bacterium]
MRTVALAVAVLVCGPAFAQLPNGQPVSNPIPAPTGEPGILPGGTDISRPLTPVGPPPVEPPPPVVLEAEPAKPVKIEKVRASGPLGPWWDSDDLLLWWSKSHSIPTLATGTRTGAAPILGRPDTRVLIGEGSLANQVVAGGRFVRGWSLNPEQTVGIEFAYFFLGSRSANVTVPSLNSRFSTIGMPYINAAGNEDVLTIAAPNRSATYLTVGVNSRVQGFEANAIANLFAVDHAKLHFIAGYRYFQLNEGLRIEQTYIEAPPFRNSTMIGRAADQFDTANRFSGGQLGLHADFDRGPFFVEMVGKVAFGQNFEVVRVGGETHTVTADAAGAVSSRSFQSGIYAQPSNTARVTNSVFAVVPEGTFKVGLKSGDRCRWFCAYNFLYLSDAVRPGDQVDRVLSASQVPLFTGVPASGLNDRPRAAVNRTDFWVQGVVIGFEGRY